MLSNRYLPVFSLGITLVLMSWVGHHAQAATINVPGDFATIQEAIADAGTVNGDEIVVAPGTYVEAINFLGKAITVRSASGDPSDTIIDGTGNFHVVQCVNGETSTTVLQGFTITGGNANGSNPGDRGGGMFNNGASPTVTNCVFTLNNAKGIGGHGGGMYNELGNPIVTDCTFDLNTAEGNGGGMHNRDSSPMVTNCTFSGNTADFGGGMHNVESGPTVRNCTFSGNTATSSGGGMSNVLISSPTVTNCTFSGNTASVDGGGMYNDFSGLLVMNCTFFNNTAINGGGMRNDFWSRPIVTNCIFSRNLALDGNGAGMSNFDKANPVVVNCTFSNNEIIDNPEGGGGMSNELISSPTVINTIFWGNIPEQIDYDLNSIREISYSLVQGGSAGMGIVDADPLFLNAPNDDLHLQAGSPAIDAGSNALTGGRYDLDGNNRHINDPGTPDTGFGPEPPVVDMGAYEFGTSICLCDNGLEGDLNCDGIVNMLDLVLLAQNFLETI